MSHPFFNRPRRFPPSLGFLLVIVLLASCLPGAKHPPNVAPSRTLELAGEGGDGAASARFGVVFASPKGEAGDAAEVMIVFNRPMRPLTLADEGEGEGGPGFPARIVAKGTNTPPPGTWRWMGTRALVFVPGPPPGPLSDRPEVKAAAARLPRATEFTVTVPAGTKALDGATLDADYTFDFQTPRLALEWTSPADGDEQLEPGATFQLRFNQSIALEEVQRGVRLLVGGDGGKSAGRPAAFTASWPKPSDRSVVKLAPRAPLPKASRIQIALDPSLRGAEGPRPIGARKDVVMRTYGPLEVRRVSCPHGDTDPRCSPGGWIDVDLSNDVTFKDFKAHVRVEPVGGAPAPKIRWSTARDDEELSSGYGFSIDSLPGRSYRIVITAGLRDHHGQTLARDAAFPIQVGDLRPWVGLGLAGEIFEPPSNAGRREIPITSVNVPSSEVVTGALDERAVAELLAPGAYGVREARFDRALRALGTKPTVVRSTAAKNAQHTHTVPLDGQLAGGRGAGVVGIRYTDAWGRPATDTRVFSVTNLAIAAKLSRFGGLVWVTHLSDARPVADAVVSIVTRGKGAVFSTRTDANGLATIPADRYQAVVDGSADHESIVVARAGDDWSFRRVSDAVHRRHYDTPIDESGRLSTLGLLFTERGVYRPGETVRVKGILRKEAVVGTESLAGREVDVGAIDGEGERFFSKRVTLDAFGGFAVDVPIPATTHLGGATVHAKLEDEDDDVSESFQIQAYKPVEFKVAVEPDRASYVRGDKASLTVRGDYLFGAPMSGQKVRYAVLRGRGEFVPPGAEGLVLDDDAYAIDLPDTSFRGMRVTDGDGALDAKGSFATSVALTMPHQRGAEVVTFEADVEDVSRETVAGRSSFVVHPGEFYVALERPKDFFVAKGTAVRAQVSAVEPSGRLRAGVPVHVELVRRTWRTVIERTGEAEGHYRSRAVDRTVSTCDVITAAAPTACTVKVDEAGYFLLRATAKDRRGNPLAASTPFYGTGDGEDLGWLTDDSTRLELVADKKAYEIGDTARILVKSPFREAEALVTVERAGVLRSERRSLRGAAPTLTIPITEDMRPNAYVAVHLVRGRTKGAPEKGLDVGAPAFRLGYAELRVNPEARRLKVAITPSKKDYHPGEVLEADVAVTDRAGKPAKGAVTFYAVDEGVLMLTGYRTPDPLPAFTAPRALSVFALESRTDLGKIFRVRVPGAGTDKGDEGGGGGGSPVRGDFRATAYFEPSILTGPDGKAHVRFKLPDSLTTYRLMAVVAGEEERFGFGEARVTASRTLMARPALPRFLRAGDAIEAGVILSSKAKAPAQVEVVASARGVVVKGDPRRVVTLPAGGSVEVRWPIEATSVGRATLTFRASGGGETDAVEVTREVSAPLALETVALYGETREAAAERLGSLEAMRPDVGALDVRLASTALVGLGDGAEQLLEYPYGCTEQLTSRLVPMIPLRALAQQYAFALPPDVDRVIDETIAKILANQHPNGEFGYWPDSRYGDRWVTAYALWALDLARKAGHKVPKAAFDAGVRALRGYLQRARWQRYELDDLAFALDVLAAIGKPDPGYATRLYERRNELSLVGRSLLAHAMVLSSMDRGPIQELARDLEGHLRIGTSTAVAVEEGAGRVKRALDSDGRTTALVLRALVAVDPKHAMAARLARGLLGQRERGRWRSTQEAAWALLALDDYRRAQEKGAPDFDATAFFGSTELFTAAFHGRDAAEKVTSVPASALFAGGRPASGSTLAFQVHGTGTLFYEARLRYARKELPRDELDRGFYVRKLARVVAPNKLEEAQRTDPTSSATSVAAGDLVLVDLYVVTPEPREHVVVDDPLPAGLEAINAAFLTSARSLAVDAGGDETHAAQGGGGDEGRRWWSRYLDFHREIHDDRVLTFIEHLPAGMFHFRYLARATTHGRFVVPPTRAECMYDPAVFGRTAASSFEVRRR